MFDGRKTKTENDTLRDINPKRAHNGYYLDKEKYTENNLKCCVLTKNRLKPFKKKDLQALPINNART